MARFGSLVVQRGKADVAASQTGSELVAAQPGRRIRVLSMAMICGDTGTTSTFLSGGNSISPVFDNGANGGAVLPHNPLGWLETNVGEALNVTTGAGSSTGFLFNYVVI